MGTLVKKALAYGSLGLFVAAAFIFVVAGSGAAESRAVTYNAPDWNIDLDGTGHYWHWHAETTETDNFPVTCNGVPNSGTITMNSQDLDTTREYAVTSVNEALDTVQTNFLSERWNNATWSYV